MKRLLLSFAFALYAVTGILAQPLDTSGIYSDRKDTLGAAVFTATQAGNYIPRNKDFKVEVITAAGLCKMACCNLAESFENSASVTVGYADAVTGARQIRLLGQNGIYTQMLDENRPVMRGIAAPFGLNYVPSQWLESIQVAKGVTSVINGVESMTGQINMEHRKPTDEKPLFLQASFMSDTKLDFNAASSLQIGDDGKWSTVILAHYDQNFSRMDHNKDGFMDDPMTRTVSLSNRWLYYDPSGTQVRFGVSGILGRNQGGQMPDVSATPWSSDILNRSLNGYLKVGVPLNPDNTSNIALVADYTWQSMDAKYGLDSGKTLYTPIQQTAFVNLLYQNQDNEAHHFTLGLNYNLDVYNEFLQRIGTVVYPGPKLSFLNDAAVFGEYTFHSSDKFSAIVGLRGDYYNYGPQFSDFRFSPRLTLKYAPVESLVLRANGGRGLRPSTPIVDNIGVLSTGKYFGVKYGAVSDLYNHTLEDSWTFGANVTWYMPFDKNKKTYLSLDYFRTDFTEQVLVENNINHILFYKLSDKGDRNWYSYTNNVQLDFSSEMFKGFTLTLTARYTDPRQSLLSQSSDVKPMTSLFKGVLNIQYATNLNKWIFDFTASANGPCRVWDFMKEWYPSGYTPWYPMLYAQVTRRFRGFDVYIGGENLTGFRQSDPIINAADPSSCKFDASCIWGPLMGAKFYAGVRFTLWKQQ